jgi:DTW domain-containing protein YfiP
VKTRLAVHVLLHHHEQHKPSSTGTLIARVVDGAVAHVFQRERGLRSAAAWPTGTAGPRQALWILHPSGEPLPSLPSADGSASGSGPAILLLDGTWRQAGEMLRSLEAAGRCVRLQDAHPQPSRYWLRDQPGPCQLSTAEALASVFHAVGEAEAKRRLTLHFELHVCATLLARGKREMAERYLGHSPLLREAPAAVDRLLTRVHDP